MKPDYKELAKADKRTKAELLEVIDDIHRKIKVVARALDWKGYHNGYPKSDKDLYDLLTKMYKNTSMPEIKEVAIREWNGIDGDF